MPTAPLVVPLEDLPADAVALAGGKGNNLAALIRAGLPVPPGFVLTTEAFRAALSTGAPIEGGATSPPVPADVARSVVAAYTQLGAGPVAVRSSGTAEDLAGAAFAGQHDTFLNVVGADQLLEAVRDCWASLWGERAVDYRSRIGTGGDLAMAVVVQRMVPARVAGVMFTAHPVTGARDVVVIEASPGLGEAVVSGLSTPDHIVVSKRTGLRRTYTPGRAELVVTATPGGGVTQTVAGPGDAAALTIRQVRRLTELARRIEHFFGAPQDIEWALADGEIVVVQARPMTALPEPLKIDFRQRVGATMLAELIPARPLPLDVSGWMKPTFQGVRQFMAAAGLRMPALETMLVERDGVVVRVVPPVPPLGPGVPARLIRSAIANDTYSADALATDPRMVRFFVDVRAGLERDLASVPYADLGPLLAEALTLFGVVMDVRCRFLARSTLAAARFQAVLRLLGRGHLSGALMAGVETKTAQTNRALDRLADRVRAEPALMRMFATTLPDRLAGVLADDPAGRGFLSAFEDFLAEYGHREELMLSVSQPAWRDAPEGVLGLLKGLVAAEPATRAASATGVVEAELFAHPAARLLALRRRLERWLAQARDFTQFREDTHFYATMAQPVVRRILMEYARRLTEAGALATPTDVFWLHREELTGVEWPPSATQLRRLAESVRRRRQVFDELGPGPVVDPRYLSAAKPDPDALLSGLPAAAGRATGPVRLVHSAAEFDRLRVGEVLVAPYTNPTWTPLFRRAAAIIVDTGGPASHAAIVAREYAIPAVLGTRTAMTTLTDGQRVTVDGSRGQVLSAGG